MGEAKNEAHFSRLARARGAISFIGFIHALTQARTQTWGGGGGRGALGPGQFSVLAGTCPAAGIRARGLGLGHPWKEASQTPRIHGSEESWRALAFPLQDPTRPCPSWAGV